MKDCTYYHSDIPAVDWLYMKGEPPKDDRPLPYCAVNDPENNCTSAKARFGLVAKCGGHSDKCCHPKVRARHLDSGY